MFRTACSSFLPGIRRKKQIALVLQLSTLYKDEHITFCQLSRSGPSNLLTPLIFEMPKRTSGFIIVAMINLVHVLIALVAQCQANATVKHAFLSPVLYQQNIRTKKNRSLVGYLEIYVFL
ncbi:hypothetical protein SDC9_95302 [bioreactor metagenome]|uniref:Uncharacterized protein n=1 Tax=bioreactor metagenome TaxID=1076179 RepID=A0A645A680_9ZZZZ